MRGPDVRRRIADFLPNQPAAPNPLLELSSFKGVALRLVESCAGQAGRKRGGHNSVNPKYSHQVADTLTLSPQSIPEGYAHVGEGGSEISNDGTIRDLKYGSIGALSMPTTYLHPSIPALC